MTSPLAGSHQHGSTVQRRLGPGRVLREGTRSTYRGVAVVDGEPHSVRDDLAPAGGAPAAGAGRRALLVLAHVTDLQLADVQSPTRFEFLNREFADPRYAMIVPVQRPQEALTAHAVEATLRTVNALEGGPVSGAPLQLAVTTGDAIDNAQWNEVQNFLRLFDGGLVRPGSGGPEYEGVQSLEWPDDIFWKPDGVPASGPDVFRQWFGFPEHPGLLQRALADFTAAGLDVPWLACFGNHEALNQGVGVVTAALAGALVGDRKPLRLQPGFDPEQALESFTLRPEVFMAGDLRVVSADPDRRAVSRREFVEAHFLPGTRPYGHGFEERNRLDGTAYYVHDLPGLRLVALDTTCLAGGADGCLDEDQAAWLEDRLAEVHGQFRSPDGGVVRTGNDDRLVVLFSHHGVETLAGAPAHAGPDGARLLGGPELLRIVHRFDNVVLWLNGHTHTNTVCARRHPQDPARGFWEVTTCAVVDWPCQTRVVELLDNADGTLSIVCTMLDHDSPTSVSGPASAFTGADIAGLHRELAGNVPFDGFDSPRSGTPADRNVELRLAAPFPLHRV
ncbi:MAG: TIGR03767 family metallophosphoesterase [Actinomycetes bacterium]